MADMFKWIAVLTALIVGLGFVLQPTLISSLPKLLHFIIGLGLLGFAGFGIYKLA